MDSFCWQLVARRDFLAFGGVIPHIRVIFTSVSYSAGTIMEVTGTKRIRLTNATPTQMEMLLSLLEEQPKLATGKLDPSFTKLHRRNGCEELAQQLNAIGDWAGRSREQW